MCPEQLTEELVGNLIDRVEVGEAYYEDGKKKQEIRILFNFVGEIDWKEIEGNESERDEIDGDENKRDDDIGTDDNVTENSVYEIEGGRRPRSK